jgi:hypothetical protein
LRYHGFGGGFFFLPGFTGELASAALGDSVAVDESGGDAGSALATTEVEEGVCTG